MPANAAPRIATSQWIDAGKVTAPPMMIAT